MQKKEHEKRNQNMFPFLIWNSKMVAKMVSNAKTTSDYKWRTLADPFRVAVFLRNRPSNVVLSLEIRMKAVEDQMRDLAVE